jgi:hypothetical protein
MMDRPYCLQELKDLETELHEKYRLSDVFAEHYPCDHKYRVKKGGRKEQFILDQYNSSDGRLDGQTCSVCFKLRTSLENSNKPTLDIIENIKKNDNDEKKLDINFLKNKIHFYKWLFQHDY